MPTPVKSLLLTSLLLAPLVWSAPLQAASPLTLPGGALGDSLDLFSRQAGVTLSYEAHLVQGLQAAPLEGDWEPAAALASLLRGTDLEAVPLGQNAWTLQRRAAPADAQLLTPIPVRGQVQSEKDVTYQSPSSVNVLTREHLERFRGTSVGDIFQGTAGVLVGENRNSGGLDVNIRGMQGQGRVPVLVDGARQETTVYRGYSGVASRSYVDPDLIGSVRIDKGPVMTAEGTGATGGVVSMRTLSAEDLLQPGKTFGIRLRGSLLGNNSGSRAPVGSSSGYNVNGLDGEGRTLYRVDCQVASLCEGPHDLANAEGPAHTMNRPGLLDLRGWSGSLALARRTEWVELLAAYAQRHQGNYYAGRHGPAPRLDTSERYDRGFWTEVRPSLTGATRFRARERIANTHYESRSLLLKSRFYLPSDQTLEVAYLRYSSDYGELMPSQLIWLGEIRETEGSHAQAETYTARYHWQPIWTRHLDVKANLWLTDTTSKNRNYSSELTWGANETEDYRRWGLDLSNRMQWFRWGEWNWTYGLAYQDEELSTRSDDDDTGSVLPVDTSGRNGNRQEVSAFTNLEWLPVPGITLNAGVRFSRFDSEDDKATLVQEGSSFCTDSDGDGQCDLLYYSNSHQGFAPLFSVSWEVFEGVQLYARHAEALRMPSLFEGTSGFSTSPALDVNLKPERARNQEVGLNLLRQSLFTDHDRAGFKLTYFRNHVDDYLTRTSPNLWEDGAAQRFFTTRNIESAEFFGTEINLSYDAGRWYLDASGTHYHHIEMCHYGSYRRDRCTDYGIADSYLNNMIPPNWHASATAGLRLFRKQLELGVRTTWMGRRNRTPEYDDQTRQGMVEPIQWHAYRLHDLFISYSPTDTFRVDFNIDNLTDQYYLDALSLGLVPAPGRSARLSFSLNFQ